MASPRLSPIVKSRLHHKLVQHITSTPYHSIRPENRPSVHRPPHIFILTRRRIVPNSGRSLILAMGPQEHITTRNANPIPIGNRGRSLSELSHTIHIEISTRNRSRPLLRASNRRPDTFVQTRRGGVRNGPLQRNVQCRRRFRAVRLGIPSRGLELARSPR